MKTRVFLGLGSNSRREAALAEALRRLREAFGELRCSPVYESAAVGGQGHAYLNLAVALDTGLPVGELKTRLRDIEQAVGRVRGGEDVVIDIDILTYGDFQGDVDGVRLPRRELLERAYVLGPLADIAPDACHPLTGLTYLAHWRSFPDRGQLRQTALVLS